MVCDGCSVVVKVLACRKDSIFINDGAFGNLSEAGPLFNTCFPVRLIRQRESVKAVEKNLKEFQFYGPTCDSYDIMEGPFQLPYDVKSGDYIEIGQAGAYSIAVRTPFNGFDETMIVLVNDNPLRPPSEDDSENNESSSQF